MLDGWKRPSNALPPPFWPTSPSANVAPTPDFSIKSRSSLDLVQDAATDCSVVASLTAVYARRERGFEKVLNSIEVLRSPAKQDTH